MKIKNLLWSFFALCISFSCSRSQETTENNSIISEVHKICSKADVLNIEQKVESTEIEFLCHDKPYSLVLDKQGNVLYKESPFEHPQSFLQQVNKKIQKSHPQWIIDEVSLIETPDTSFVKIEVIKNGVEENLFFTLNGKLYKFKQYTSNEVWTTSFLKESNYYKSLHYDFLNSVETFDVPEVLKEISGISVVGDTALFCIQDELGVVFQIDLRDKSLSTVGRFTDIGDFEDVQVVDNNVYVLRSDGNIFSFNYEKYNGKIEQSMLNIPCMNMEGLFFDKQLNQFLVSCKEPAMGFRSTNKKQHRQDLQINADKERIVYTFDKNSIVSPQKFISIAIEDIRQFIQTNYNITTIEAITCNPSAIAKNPITNDYYILSAADKMIVVYDNKNTLKDVILLSPDDFYKPEGIDFLSNGDMIICSEGMKKGSLQGQITIIKLVNND